MFFQRCNIFTNLYILDLPITEVSVLSELVNLLPTVECLGPDILVYYIHLDDIMAATGLLSALQLRQMKLPLRADEVGAVGVSAARRRLIPVIVQPQATWSEPRRGNKKRRRKSRFLLKGLCRRSRHVGPSGRSHR